jgi:hypothetical protein
MKPKWDFDPMFPTNRRPRFRPLRWIGAVLIVTALGGLTLRAGPIPKRRSASSPLQIVPMPGGYVVLPGAAPNPRAVRVQPRDRFVIVAPAELDTAMVIRAPENLDAAMVFNPETGRRGSAMVGSASAVAPTVPDPAQGAVPHELRPAPSSPRPRAVPRPR